MIRRLIILLLIVGRVFGAINDRDKFIFYVSPGIQIGHTFNEGLFYGLQISLGFGMPWEIGYQKYAIPALSFGITQSFHNKLVKKYLDLQITYVDLEPFSPVTPLPCGGPLYDDCPDRSTFFPPVGIGIGKIFKEKSSDYRLKVYVWFISNLTYDYELQSKLHSLSLIPVFPRAIPY